MVLFELKKKYPGMNLTEVMEDIFMEYYKKTIEILKKTYINEEIYHVLALENPFIGRWQFSLN